MAANALPPAGGPQQLSKHSTSGLLSLGDFHSPGSRTGSRLRSPYADMIVDFFRAPEHEIRLAAIEFIANDETLITESDLDTWERRPSGVLVVGSSKALISRLLRGDTIKDQAAGAIRTITGNLTYLNLAQLVVLKQKCHLHIEGNTAPRPELRDFSNCLDEALNEKLVTTLLNRSNLYYQVDKELGVEVETFSHAERKFLGRRLILHIGALSSRLMQGRTFSFDVHGSEWFLFCGVKAPDTHEEVRGLHVVYPSLDVHLGRTPDVTIYCLAELRDSDGGLSRTAATGQVSWHLLSTPPSMTLDELVRASLSFKVSMVGQYPTAGSRVKKSLTSDGGFPAREEDGAGAAAEAGADRDAEIPEPETPTEMTKTPEEPLGTWEQTQDQEEVAEQEGETAEEEGTEQGEEEWYMQAPVEYDEAVPTYYDIYQEIYFYYGNALFYDADSEWYYYFDWDQQGYAYIDEETQIAINAGALPLWNQEDGQYYDPSDWYEEAAGGEDDAAAAAEYSEETAGEQEQLAEQAAIPAEETQSQAAQEEERESALARLTETEPAPGAAMKGETETTAAAVPELIVATSPAAEADDAEADAPGTLAGEGSEASSDVPGDIVEEGTSLRAPKGSLYRNEAKAPVSAPPTVPEKFSGSIDQFQASQGMLINYSLKEIVSLFDDHLEVLTRYEKRPNGTLYVGRSRRTIDALIKGAMELKALTPTDCADIATSLSHLHLAQLLYIRRNAQNSAWDKSPLSTLKNFAMKTDSLIGEKFFLLLLQRGAIGDEMEKLSVGERDTPAAKLLQELSIVECRQAGSQAIFVIGATAELKQAKGQILGAEYTSGNTPKPQSSWWWLPCTPTGAAAAPRGAVTGNPKGVFFQYPELLVQFNRPEGVQVVYKLVAGRQAAGFLTWDVLQITL